MSILDDIKTMLDINLEDDSYNLKLNIIIEDGKQYLRRYNPLLSDEDFITPTNARRLLSSYCRYAFSNATEMFKNNYKDDLLSLRQEYEVAAEYGDQNTD